VAVTYRQATETDLPGILAIHRAAFADDSVADLTAALLSDPSAQPVFSLVAVADHQPVGHVLFTAARFEPDLPRPASLLAPLGVVPEWQRRGVGGRLVEDGLALLAHSGVSMVFVLGHPAYYPRFGFVPAGRAGFAAPYPIPARNADAWMILAIGGDLPVGYAGRVRCAKALNHPEHWRE
jgi:putative acetyltransferase